MNRHIYVSAALAALLATSYVPAASADQVIGDLEDGRVQIVSFKGAPPFRRQTVDVSTLSRAEVDRLAELDARSVLDQLTTTTQVAGNRGKPPYRRTVEQAAEVQGEEARFARFEETPAATERSGRRGPPGKRFPFRHR